MHAAAHGGIESAAEESIGGGIGAGLLLLLGVNTLLIASAAESQQCCDVGLRQWWIAANGDGHFPVRGSVDAQRNVIVFHARCCIQVDGGFNADRVGEGDVAALEIVAGSSDHRASLGDGDAAQQGG